MTDSSSHFDNEDMNTFCSTHGIEHITTPAYALWTNGLIKNMNKILLGHLKQMCAPDMEDMEANDTNMETTPAHWTNHVKEAIHSMNDRILPALGFMPRELLWGRREATGGWTKGKAVMEATELNASHHFLFSDLLRSQGYTRALAEAARRKTWFDDRVHLVEFKAGDLVQVYDSRLDTTYETRAKLLPCWSPSRIVTDHLLNSYTLCRLDGTDMNGTTHARHLHRFIPRRDGPLSHAHRPDTDPGWIQEWEEEDEAIEAIEELFENPNMTRTHVSSKEGQMEQ